MTGGICKSLYAAGFFWLKQKPVRFCFSNVYPDKNKKRISFFQYTEAEYRCMF